MALKIKREETILFIGDSITDGGRTTGQGPLGNGYVRLLHDLAAIREPKKRITVLNRGINGNTVDDLERRWETDVLAHKPAWLSVMIGINDLHRFLRGDAEAVSPEHYAQTYQELLARTRKDLPRCRLVLAEPFYICRTACPRSFEGRVLKILPRYLLTVHKLSRKYKTRLVRTHQMFQALLQNHNPDLFCPEAVHPNPTGHLALAEKLYRSLSA